MKQILLDFWNFIKKPKDEQYIGSETYKWKVFFSLFGLKLLFLIVYIPLVRLVDDNIEYDHAFDEKNHSVINAVLSIVLAAPLIEEVLFRLGLRRQFLLKKLISEQKWSNCFPFFVYSSSIIFGVVHLNNYTDFNHIFLFVAPIMILSNLLGGFIVAFIRVRFNFVIGFVFHAFWNFFVLFIIDGSYYALKEDKVEIKNNTYQLTIEPKQFLPLKPSPVYYHANIDSIYSLKTGTKSMNDILNLIAPLDTIYEKNAILVDFQFTSKKGISRDSLLNTLETEGYIEKKTRAH